MVALPARARSASASILRRSYPTSIRSSRAATRMACSRASARGPEGRWARRMLWSTSVVLTVCLVPVLSGSQKGTVPFTRTLQTGRRERNRFYSIGPWPGRSLAKPANPVSGTLAARRGARPRVPRLEGRHGGGRGLEGTAGRCGGGRGGGGGRDRGPRGGGGGARGGGGY